MFTKLAKDNNSIQRFAQQPKTRQGHKRHHETNFMECLHKMQGSNDSTSSKADLYHLPLSTNYYRRLSQKRFVYHGSSQKDNTVPHFNTCVGCRSFVSARRRTLLRRTRQARRKQINGDNVGKAIGCQVASVEDLFEIMVSSDSSCAFSGLKGVWHSFSAYRAVSLYSLSLDHKVPLSKGGSSLADNLQVSLVCFNTIKGSHSNKRFIKWWKAFSKKQGYF